MVELMRNLLHELYSPATTDSNSSFLLPTTLYMLRFPIPFHPSERHRKQLSYLQRIIFTLLSLSLSLSFLYLITKQPGDKSIPFPTFIHTFRVRNQKKISKSWVIFL